MTEEWVSTDTYRAALLRIDALQIELAKVRTTISMITDLVWPYLRIASGTVPLPQRIISPPPSIQALLTDEDIAVMAEDNDPKVTEEPLGARSVVYVPDADEVYDEVYVDDVVLDGSASAEADAGADDVQTDAALLADYEASTVPAMYDEFVAVIAEPEPEPEPEPAAWPQPSHGFTIGDAVTWRRPVNGVEEDASATVVSVSEVRVCIVGNKGRFKVWVGPSEITRDNTYDTQPTDSSQGNPSPAQVEAFLGE